MIERVWLGVATVVVLVAGVAGVDAGRSPGAGRAAGARPRAAHGPRADAEPIVLRPVRLDALTASREQPNATTRNPFRFQPTAVAAAAAAADVRRRRRSRSRAGAAVVPAGPPPPPPIPLKFIGVVKRANGVKWAVLSDGKSAPQHGKEGDIIDGRYRILQDRDRVDRDHVRSTAAAGRRSG